MTADRPRLLYVALADARGHLMRAHVLSGVLARHGVDVDVVTTHDDGAAFLAKLGTPAHGVLPGGFGMVLGPRHDFRAGKTRRRVLRYALRDLRRDIDVIRALARDIGADVVVNDSFHPALLSAHVFAPELFVVHVHGENLRDAVRSQARPMRVDRWLAHARQIVHVLDDNRPTAALFHTVRLPPVIALPSRSLDEVRRDYGLDDDGSGAKRVCAVYLNPHYREPSIAELVEGAVADAGFALAGVSEAFAHRPGWRATDPAFVDVVAGACVFVSGAGMGALEQARATGTPLVCLLGDQLEQTKNVVERGLASVRLESPDARRTLTRLLVERADTTTTTATTTATAATASAEISRVQSLWADALLSFLEEAAHRSPPKARRRRASRAAALRPTPQTRVHERRHA